jgi:NhaP-type Na+/H+ or K+/H+ antiporter
MSITMFDSVKTMIVQNGQAFDIAGPDVGFLILKFLEVFVCSILIGFIVGILTTIVFKNLRFLVE